MNQLRPILVTSWVLFQFVTVKSTTIKSSGSISGTSTLYQNDWTGERLQFAITRGQSNDTEQFVAINVNDDSTLINFNCSRRRQIKIDGSGETISYPTDNVKLVNGSAIYLNNDTKPWCNWTIKLEDNSAFPMALIKPIELIVTPTEYQVIVHLNETLPIAPVNLSSLPAQLIQQFKDYKVIGNSRYQIFTRTINRVDFALAVNYSDDVKQFFPKIVTISLVNPPYDITVQCNFTSSKVDGHLKFGGRSIWNDLINGYNYQLSDNQITNGTICQWSIPNQIEFDRYIEPLNISTGRYNLTIVTDSRFVVFNQLDFTL